MSKVKREGVGADRRTTYFYSIHKHQTKFGAKGINDFPIWIWVFCLVWHENIHAHTQQNPHPIKFLEAENSIKHQWVSNFDLEFSCVRPRQPRFFSSNSDDSICCAGRLLLFGFGIIEREKRRARNTRSTYRDGDTHIVVFQCRTAHTEHSTKLVVRIQLIIVLLAANYFSTQTKPAANPFGSTACVCVSGVYDVGDHDEKDTPELDK